jgi:hypothetical protein
MQYFEDDNDLKGVIEMETIQNERNEHEQVQDERYDRFGSFTEAYEILVSACEKIEKIKWKVAEDFKPIDSKDYFYNPLDSSRVSIKDKIGEARKEFTSLLVKELNKEYRNSNMHIDDKAVHDFVKAQGRFDHWEIITFIKTKYADVDAEALRQIKVQVKSLLPAGNFSENKTWSVANKPEHISDNPCGINLRAPHGYDGNKKSGVSALIKLISITLQSVKPTEAVGHDVEQGATYRDSDIKSLRYFKNNSLKVIMHRKDDADKVREAILC